jgi:tripartite-type tricarboxylate transporter receptor subunit TctC
VSRVSPVHTALRNCTRDEGRSFEVGNQKDFEPVALLATNLQLIVAKDATPAKNLNELIAWLTANPGKASQGTAGVGSPAHVSGAYFQKETGTHFQFVPYRGAAPAMQDLIAGQIDLMFDQALNSLPHVRGGKIKAYAVTANTRLASAPEIPTVDEAGLPGSGGRHQGGMRGNAMKLPRRQFLHLAAVAAVLPAVSRIARAQTYPTRPVRIIVGAAPSGTYDIMARLIGEWLSERFGQPFVIENRPGAGHHYRH